MITGIRTNITIGNFEFNRAPRLWIEGQRHTCLARAGVTLPDPTGELLDAINVGTDQITIRYGYRDQDPAEWTGTVVWTKPGTLDQIEVGAVGKSKALAETRITQSWMNESPEAIIRYAAGRAGVSVGRLDSPGVIIPRFIASDKTPWDIALMCNQTVQRSYGRDMSKWAFYLADDGVHWGDHDLDGDTPVIATAEGLIAHRPAGDKAALSQVETFLQPGFRHSRVFRLRDVRRGIDADYRTLKVRHEINDTARTFIWYGEEHGRI
jgi:hypothetical protein